MVIHVLLAADRLALERPWRAWDFADALMVAMKLKQENWYEVERDLRCDIVERINESEPPVGLRSAEVWDIKEVHEWMQEDWMAW